MKSTLAQNPLANLRSKIPWCVSIFLSCIKPFWASLFFLALTLHPVDIFRFGLCSDTRHVMCCVYLCCLNVALAFFQIIANHLRKPCKPARSSESSWTYWPSPVIRFRRRPTCSLAEVRGTTWRSWRTFTSGVKGTRSCSKSIRWSTSTMSRRTRVAFGFTKKTCETCSKIKSYPPTCINDYSWYVGFLIFCVLCLLFRKCAMGWRVCIYMLYNQSRWFPFGSFRTSIVSPLEFCIGACQDMIGPIERLKPVRWKVFQCLLIQGENAGEGAKRNAEALTVTSEEFQGFLQRHRNSAAVREVLVPEDNETMKDSYLILDEYLCFLNCTTGGKVPSPSIREVSVARALREAGFDLRMFVERHGEYEWSKEKVFKSAAKRSYHTKGLLAFGISVALILLWRFQR